MANEFNASYFCFTQARCRLCQFPVHRGDVIIAVRWCALHMLECQGLKVRSIQSSQMQDLALVGWPTPLSSPPLVVKLATLEPPRDPPDGLRMDFFDCNAPYTIGYSVAVKGRAIAGVVAHKIGEAAVRSVYEKTCPTDCYWQFMPINEGEYLTDICRLTTPPFAMGQDVTGMTVREMPFLYH
ncbi:hypothetical protein CCHR01_05368 [Colletotrichum chrysophilum]|uniref:Uncharacterized protein n=1 Tax=Colletotrichum chrysophilum TaxID=1836956 RepID=A0AAD9ELN3_9PEZI|nr:hypothetical protein CCHR01_05368 [Colletotrichum chrysophilum]